MAPRRKSVLGKTLDKPALSIKFSLIAQRGFDAGTNPVRQSVDAIRQTFISRNAEL
jgi:hypothetical protein